MTGYIARWFTCLLIVTHPSINPAVQSRESNSQPVDRKSDAITTTPPSHQCSVLDNCFIIVITVAVKQYDIEYCRWLGGVVVTG